MVPSVNSAKTRAMVYAGFLSVLATCGVLVQGIRWHGNAELHTLIETVSTLLALMGGAIALARYYSRRPGPTDRTPEPARRCDQT